MRLNLLGRVSILSGGKIKLKPAQFYFLTWLIVPIFTCGCTNISSTMSNITTETPHSATTNLTETLKCMGQNINQAETGTILLLVDDFYDGTMPVVSDSKVMTGKYLRSGDGPLADGGKYDFEAVIRRCISHKKIIIPYSLPIGLQLREDEYGRLPPEYLMQLAKMYGTSTVIRVKGVYTQNDSSDYINKGLGSGADIKGNDGEAELEYGISKSSRSLSLTVYLGEAFSNTVGAATTLTLNSYTESDKFSVGFGYGEGSMSFAQQSKLKEGLHGAQRTLVEAAVLWALRGLYQQIDFSSCLAVNGPSPNRTVSAYQKWLSLSEQKRIKYLKLMLKEKKYYSGKINNKYDADLQKAISSYEIDNEMLIPHTQNNLGDLFLQLYMKIDIEKIEKLSCQDDDFL
ncbi:hypothetical protein VU07_01025 [Desulfobulbus sp. F4]|nr:hypothetical protein [Desulfobulbus sp. F3]MCW5200389.1 hypothetical protein [Desulfobulbus sp. F4]